MAMKDQFQDKTEELQRNAKQRLNERRDQASERGQQMPERERPAERERPDRERPDRERPERRSPEGARERLDEFDV
ncbi:MULTISPECIES: hypothetical protein [Streptomyces]|uniref:Uncharacterized protein n=1 Tax=Streptomyces tauricus TaxID=68274 RepID=A0ABZ1JKB8_9ACTN|nr:MULTISPECIES: hypothetical protein [Streptomyces]MCW8095185.1 hypothetical protein [Streptomyces tauricus]UPZ29570.1 hypothetical protein MUK60_18260 [Streptomyces sp. LRE541]